MNVEPVHSLVTCYLSLMDEEAVALLVSISFPTVICKFESVDRFSFDHTSGQTDPPRDHSICEEVSLNWCGITVFVQLEVMTSSIIVTFLLTEKVVFLQSVKSSHGILFHFQPTFHGFLNVSVDLVVKMSSLFVCLIHRTAEMAWW